MIERFLPTFLQRGGTWARAEVNIELAPVRSALLKRQLRPTQLIREESNAKIDASSFEALIKR